MTQREGHAQGGAIAPTSPHDRPATASGSVYVVSTHPPIENGFGPHHLANRPLPDQDHPSGPSTSIDVVRPLIQKALAGELSPAGFVEAITPFDRALDDCQRDAVARAVQSEDLLLIEGPTGTGKSRVAIEIVRQIIKGGDRVLFLSAEPAVLDGLITKHLGEYAVVRRLGPGERSEQLPAELARLTPHGRRQSIRESIQQRAQSALQTASERKNRIESLRPVWDELTALRDTQAKLAGERDAAKSRLDRLGDEVRLEAESTTESLPYYVQRIRSATASHARQIAALDAAAAELRAARIDADKERRVAEEECGALRPKVQALEHGRWYTLAFWRARSDSSVAEKLEQAEKRLAAAVATLDELALREQKLAGDRRLVEEEHAAELTRFLESEVEKRSTELNAQIVECDRRLAEDAVQHDRLVTQLKGAGIDLSGGPSAFDTTLVRAVEEWERARNAADDVAQRIDELTEAEANRIDIVAGTIDGLASDAEMLAGGPFDLLLIDNAHRIVEEDFVAAARLARRWVLVGESSAANGSRAQAARPNFFTRLAAALGHQVWIRDGSRLVCRLYPVRGADRRRLECEPVADAPDIELRLFNPPGGEPTLAEVAFPNSISPAAAREYLCRELAEVTCQVKARSVRWETTSGGLVARFGPASNPATFAEIGPGIREELGDLDTRAIHFAADWPIERAKEWVSENIGSRDSGRVVSLKSPQRACPGLARWLNRAFDAGFSIPMIADDVAHVEFLAVPDTDPRRRRETNGRPGRIGGAGYEIDLSDPRQRATLPTDCSDFPSKGFVNVHEAQALIRFLEPLHNGMSVAVTSPFPTQVAMLRRLVARSPRLANVRVLEPAEAARHECDVMAVSLTRSHVARAVAFGDGPSTLAGLIGRARKKVLFAGDPGTLARRLQWEGPVDHLDASEAARERGWVAALADCPRVTPPRPRPAAAGSARA